MPVQPKRVAKPKAVVKPKSRTRYTKELAATITDSLANGKTLTSICKKIGFTPAIVYRWTKQFPEFHTAFYEAREFGDAVLEDHAIDLSDTRKEDIETYESSGDKGSMNSTTTRDNVARSRLMAETRLKVVARRKGAKITQEIKAIKATEAELVHSFTNEQLLDIVHTKIDNPTEEDKE